MPNIEVITIPIYEESGLVKTKDIHAMKIKRYKIIPITNG